jgi:hypothetical protein
MVIVNNSTNIKETTAITFLSYPSSLAKGYDPLYSSSPLALLDGFSRQLE